MKNVKRYNEFIETKNEGIKDVILGGLATIGSVVTTPESSYGKSNVGGDGKTQVMQPKRCDLTGKKLNTPPSEKTQNLGNYRYLLTKKIINPSIKTDKEMKSKGWQIVWSDTIRKKSSKDILTDDGDVPKVIEWDNDKFFELGGYELTNEVKNRISEKINELGDVDSVVIESSTDKTRLTDRLKAKLSKSGYSPDNYGLSKARSNSIKKFLMELGVLDVKIEEVNLAERGKPEGYDPEYRYVKLTFIMKGDKPMNWGAKEPDEYENVVWYQRISDTKQSEPKTHKMRGSGIGCPTFD